MNRTKITLIDNQSNKKVFISSVGDTNANVVIPVNPDLNNDGVLTFEFTNKDDISKLISTKFVPDAYLRDPKITYPLSVLTDYHGGVELEQYTIPDFLDREIVTTVYEFSLTRNFNPVILRKEMKGSEVKNLPPEDMVNIGLGSEDDTGYGPETIFYVRAKIYAGSYCTGWSNLGSFKYQGSSYVKPSTPSVSEVVSKRVDVIYPYLENIKRLIPTMDLPNIRTGEIKFEVSPPKASLGSPGDPDRIIFIFQPKTPKDYLNERVEIDIPCDLSSYYTLDLIPHILYYKETYTVCYYYKNNKYNISSPVSEKIDILTTPIDVEITPVNMGIVNNQSKISKHMTVGFNNIFFSDRYLEKSLVQEYWNQSLLKDPLINPTKTIRFSFEYKQEPLGAFNKLTDEKTLVVYPNALVYLGHLEYIQDTSLIEENFDYTIKLKLNLNCIKKNEKINKEYTILQSIPTGDGITGEDATDIPKRETDDFRFGYFGEISNTENRKDNLPTYIGEFNSLNNNLFNQPGCFEYTKDNFIYVYYKQGNDLINKTIDSLTDSEYDLIYQTSIPSNTKLLSKLIGWKRHHGMNQLEQYDKEGNRINKLPFQDTDNEIFPFIKCYNQGKQFIYISKYPLGVGMKYTYLRRNFLTGNGSTTFRYGKNYFKARLMEYAPSSVLNPHYPNKIYNKTNVTNDVELFQMLFRNILANYRLGDLGITYDKGITFTNNGYIRTYKDRDLIIHHVSELKPDQWNNVDELIEDDTKSYVKDRLTYYRPVFEFVRNSNLPFRLIKKNLPGPTKLTYDESLDMGYFGKVSQSDFITGMSIINNLNLTSDYLLTNEFYFFKFYFKGRVLYIPNKPLIKVKDKYSLTQIISRGGFYGPGEKNESHYFNNIKYSISCISYSGDHLSNDDLEDGMSKDIHPNGIFTSLLSRVFNNVSVYKNTNRYQAEPLTKWETDIELMDVLQPILTIDNLNGRIAQIVKENDKIKFKESTDDVGLFWPVITVEALDYNNKLTYDKWNVRPGQISYKTVKVKTNRLVKKTVERERPVIKHKTVMVDKVVTQIIKVPNEQIIFPTVPKTSTDMYGLLLFHTLKTDPSCVSTALYQRDMLNVQRDQTGEIIQYSDKYPSYDQYLIKSVLATNKTGLVATPLHVAITFADGNTCRHYIQDMVNKDINIGVLKNSVPKIPNTDPERKYPIGVLYGNITSLISYYPLNKGYQLFNPLNEDASTMNLNPMILEKNGKMINTWTSMRDTDLQTRVIPCLSGFLDYYDFTNNGKNVINNYIKYIAIKIGLPLDKDNLQDTVSLIKNKYNFGIVGVDLDSLHYLPGGTLTGSYRDPVLRQFTRDQELTKYFSSSGYSKGNDFTDILKPEQGYDEVEKTTTIQVPVSKSYVEMETYNEEIYTTEVVEEDMRIPVYTYVDNP